jgi:S1-C subfamily serine protease
VTTRAALLLVLVVVAAVAGCGGRDAGAVDPAASVVAIRAAGCRLTANLAVGIVIGDGLVATVAHAVAGESRIDVSTPDGRELSASVAALDTALDAAVLQVGGLDLAPLDRRAHEADETVTLWTHGDGAARPSPVEVRRRVTIRTSDIYREGEHLRPGFELRADVEPGDSGGGLIAADGDLLGMVWASSRERDDRAWALPIEALDPLVAAARAGEPPPAARCAR